MLDHAPWLHHHRRSIDAHRMQREFPQRSSNHTQGGYTDDTPIGGFSQFRQLGQSPSSSQHDIVSWQV
jgi:hypothetical protein